MKYLVRLILICIPLQMQAEVCKWSNMYVDISPTKEGNVSVHFHNELTSTWGEAPFYCPVIINGELFRAVINAGNGNIPDVVSVEHPFTWYTDQNDVMVKEGEGATILLRPYLLG